MNHYPESITRLIRHFARLPGVGEKTAERLTMHILRAPRNEAEHLAQSILDLKERTRLCKICFGLADSEICGICANPSREQSMLCVVEQPADMIAIEKSGAYKGRYHILQGVLSPMEGIGPDEIRIRELLDRVASGAIKEVIIATGTNVEGESTAAYLSDKLKSSTVRVSRIASGVPMGGDLKYVDQVTLKRAMEFRRDA